MGNKRKIDWLNHSLEFAVVLVGILIAFQLNRCSEDSTNESLVDEHISYIVDETEFNKRMLSNSISESQKLQKTLDSLLGAIDAQQDFSRINMLSLKMMNLNNNYLKKNAYQTFVESGDIRFVEDFNLKNNVISLYEFYKYAEGMDEMTRNSYVQFFYPYMVENMDLYRASLQDKKVYTNKEYKNILSVYQYTLKARLGVHKQTLAKMEEFLSEYKT